MLKYIFEIKQLLLTDLDLVLNMRGTDVRLASVCYLAGVNMQWLLD